MILHQMNITSDWINYALRLIPTPEHCRHASHGCWRYCYGFRANDATWDERKALTDLFINHRSRFVDKLADSITEASADARKRGLRLAVQLNHSSDIAFERTVSSDGSQTVHGTPEIFAEFPKVQFWDETRNSRRMNPTLLPKDPVGTGQYVLAYSAEADRWAAHYEDKRSIRRVVFIVRDEATKDYYLSLPGVSIDGDKHPLTFLAPPGALVYRLAKGRAKRDAFGFVLDMPKMEVQENNG